MKQINIMTHNNGYALTVGDAKYMYFTEEKLVEGIFVHIALGIEDYMSQENIQSLITACATWPKEGDAIQAAATLMDENESLREKIMRLQKTIRDLKERIDRLTGEAKKHEKPEAPKPTKRNPDEPERIKNPLLRKERPKHAPRGRRAKADAAVLAEIERQTNEHSKEKGY